MFRLQQSGHFLDEVGIRAVHRQTYRSGRTRRRISGEMMEPIPFIDNLAKRRCVRVAARHQALQSANRPAPLKRKNHVFHCQHRRRVDCLALENALCQRAF